MLDNYADVFGAIQRGDLDSARIIARHGVNIHLKDNKDNTALHIAAECADIRCLNILLECKRIDIDYRNDCGDTALHIAVRLGHTEIVKALIEAGANINEKKRYTDYTALHMATKTSVGRRSVEILLASPQIDANAVLHWAVENGKWKCVKTLLESKKISVNDADVDGRTQLHRAVIKGFKRVVEVLLANGADVNSKDVNSWTPLHFAATSGYHEIVEILLNYGADVDTKARDGRTALHRAVISKDKDAVRLLCDKGANLFIKNKYGRTPIEYASDTGIKGILEKYQTDPEFKEVIISQQVSWAPIKRYANIVLFPMIPSAVLLAVSYNPQYHAILSGVALLSSCMLSGKKAMEASAVSCFATSTTLYCLSSTLSEKYIVPQKIGAALVALVTIYLTASKSIDNSDPQSR